MEVSVILCTHNPRPEYLRRVLEALRAQTMPASRWELLLVDNASREPLEPAWDLSWHPQARHVREDKLGVVYARARGIREASGDLMVFVDDDNVLAEDYLATAEAILRQRPHLGAIGTGCCVGEFEVPPPKSMDVHLIALALTDLKHDYWTNFGGYTFGLPLGAGMCFRRAIAEDYLRKLDSDPVRQMLGRTGPGRLLSGEDTDLALCAHDLGLGTGRFVALRVVHLIPKERFAADYLVRLYVGFTQTGEIIHFIRQRSLAPQSRAPIRLMRNIYRVCRYRGLNRRIFIAQEKARDDIRRMLANLKNG